MFVSMVRGNRRTAGRMRREEEGEKENREREREREREQKITNKNKTFNTEIVGISVNGRILMWRTR